MFYTYLLHYLLWAHLLPCRFEFLSGIISLNYATTTKRTKIPSFTISSGIDLLTLKLNDLSFTFI